MEDCPKCLGSGTIVTKKFKHTALVQEKCEICSGSGVVRTVLFCDYIRSTMPFESEVTDEELID